MSITEFSNKAKNALALRLYHSGSISTVAQRQENKRAARFVLTSALVCMVAIEPSIAAAFGNIETVATNLLTFVTGTFGRTVATIAVVVLGMMAMFGKLAWDHAIKVIFGIAIVFGAAGVIDAMTGSAMDTGIASGGTTP